MHHGWAKQEMMLGFDFESESFCAALELFERTEVEESIYKSSGALYQTKHPREDYNQVFGRKINGG